MPKLNAKDYFDKYRDGLCSPEEQRIIEGYILNGGNNHGNIENMMIELEELQARIDQIPMEVKKTNWPKRILLVAASIVIIGSIWTVFFTDNSNLTGGSYTNDIKPGSDKAVLTLANGTKINLSDAKNGAVASESGLEITKAVDGTLVYKVVGSENNQNSNEINTITTPKGGQYKIVLPDGTKVWLNAASSLSYRTSLKERGGERMINMSGEAYFEVKKDKNHPFVVSSEKMKITVLGTHFNMNAYNDEVDTKVTLLEGSVKVNLLTSSADEKILKPDQQAILKSSGSLNIADVDASVEVAWKDGEFAFRMKTLEELMKEVSRWYDVQVVYEQPALKKKLLGGSISKFEMISKVLSMIETTTNVKFKIEGKKITVTE